MNACSFHGNWIGGEALLLLFAAALALLLAPVGIGAVVGWRIGRRKGQPWRGALKGGAWVLGTYVALVALWWAAHLVERQHQLARARAEQELVDPVRRVEPGGWTALLAATDPAALPPRQRQSWTWSVVQRATQPLAWTAEDLDALGRLPPRLQGFAEGREAGHALAGLLALAREGDAGLARVRSECTGDDCRRAIDDAIGHRDQMLMTRAQQQELLWQAQPLPPELRAALERLLQRQRAYAMDWGNRGDARLAFDRLARGQLAHALEACDLPTPIPVPRNDQAHCLAEVLQRAAEHGPARLCADAPLAEEDAATLQGLQASIEASKDRRLAQLQAGLVETLQAACPAG